MWTRARPILREIKRGILYRPRGLRGLGKGSVILRPRQISGARFISVGCRTAIHADSQLYALGEYEGAMYSPRLEIGEDVYIGPHVCLTACNSLTISDGCVLSQYVYITDFLHGFSPEGVPILEQPLESKGPVDIGRGCFLGFRSAIMPGVTLGEHCVVGTNSVVTRSFPAYSMIAGCPAEVIKVYCRETKLWLRAARAHARLGG